MGAIAFVASDHQPRASRYYQFFPSEPLRDSGFIEVDGVISLKSIDIFKLLTAITRSPATKNVLIVSHGTGGGLSIPLTSKAFKTLGADETVTLSQCADGSITALEAASRLELEAGDVRVLKGAILNVRRLQIDKLVLRACSVGHFPDTLANLKHFFGAKSVCAPDVFDCFNTLDPPLPADAKIFAQFLQSTDVISEGRSPDRFARTKTISNACNFDVMTESQHAVIEWVARHFPPGKYPGKGPFAFHAQVVGNRVVFPLDPEYRAHLKRA